MQTVKRNPSRVVGAETMILIVEDEVMAGRALAALLAACGYKAEAVTSAEEALRVMENGQVPEIALIDVDLPGMSGLDLIRRMKRSNPSVVPVLVTATDHERVNAFRDTDPVSYIRKPIHFDDLLAVIASH